MKRTDLLYVVIGVLVILNLATLGFIWQHRLHARPRGPGPGPGGVPAGPGDFMTREIGFDAAQAKAFEALRIEHEIRMREYWLAMEADRGRMLDALSGNNAAQAGVLAGKIGARQKEIELLTYDHFRKVRGLCRDDQKARFDGMIRRAMRMMMSPPPPGRGPRHGPPGPPPPAR